MRFVNSVTIQFLKIFASMKPFPHNYMCLGMSPDVFILPKVELLHFDVSFSNCIENSV